MRLSSSEREIALLLSRTVVAVDPEARIVTLATYLYLRPGELEALEWEDVDLDRGIVHVHRAVDYERGSVKGTKTNRARRFPIEPALVPLLRAMHGETGGRGRVVALPSETNYARADRKSTRLNSSHRT